MEDNRKAVYVLKEIKSRPKMVAELKRRADVEMPPDVERAFNEHYDKVHLPLMAKVPGTVEIRRYKAASGTYAGTPMEGDKYIIEYVFASEDIMEQALTSPERKEALKDHILFDYLKKYFINTRTLYIPVHSISKE